MHPCPPADRGQLCSRDFETLFGKSSLSTTSPLEQLLDCDAADIATGMFFSHNFHEQNTEMIVPGVPILPPGLGQNIYVVQGNDRHLTFTVSPYSLSVASNEKKKVCY